MALKITVNLSELKAAIAAPCKVAARASVDYGACLLVRAEGDEATFQATDGDTSVATRTTVLVDSEGSACLSGKVLKGVVGTIPDAAVTITADAYKAEIVCDKSRFSIPCLDPASFPEFPKMESGQCIRFSPPNYERTVLKGIAFASKDDSSGRFRHALVEAEDGEARVVSTDGYGLVERRCSVSMAEGQEFSATIPATFLKEIPIAETVELYANEKQVKAVAGNTTYITRRVECDYPKTEQLFNSPVDKNAVVPKHSLLGSVKRVLVIKGNSQPMRISMNEKALDLELDNKDGSVVSDEIPAKCDGAGEVYVAPMLLDQALGALSDGDITLSIRREIDPVHILGSYGHVVIMPVRRPL